MQVFFKTKNNLMEIAEDSPYKVLLTGRRRIISLPEGDILAHEIDLPEMPLQSAAEAMDSFIASLKSQKVDYRLDSSEDFILNLEIEKVRFKVDFLEKRWQLDDCPHGAMESTLENEEDVRLLISVSKALRSRYR